MLMWRQEKEEYASGIKHLTQLEKDGASILLATYGDIFGDKVKTEKCGDRLSISHINGLSLKTIAMVIRGAVVNIFNFE